MSSRLITRISSSLFVLLAFLGIALNWLALSVYTPTPTVGIRLYLGLFVVIQILACIAWLGLIPQYSRERHWLGWSGIVLTICGHIIEILGVASTFAPLRNVVTVVNGFSVYALFTLTAQLLVAAGLVTWAMDIPSFSNSALLQKAIMAFIAVRPFLDSILLPTRSYLNLSKSLPSYTFIAIVSFVAVLMLGISIWQQQLPLGVIPQQPNEKITFASLEV